MLSNGIDIFEKQIYLESSPERDICRVDASQIKGYEEIRARINFHFANLRKKWLYWMQVLRWNIYVSMQGFTELLKETANCERAKF